MAMEATFTINGIDIDEYAKDERVWLLKKMLINAVHAVGYEFVNPPDIGDRPGTLNSESVKQAV